ncbi:unnamed protein product [Arabidopsis thaliana]|uniref:(thale cress) hypothetical protein n=1 Tax=Arabidopsis thaliana TaxID=3702 RepID=A0A7G2F474_ARATH|nr:unnamed protein product [Arabidopsis thaliana]
MLSVTSARIFDDLCSIRRIRRQLKYRSMKPRVEQATA